jgi:cytochrome o ubiquinol oxidase operon protein cyoD
VAENVKDTPKSNRHGSSKSYTIGFLLSLVFTIIPYFIVRGQIAADRTLILAVLGFAVVQMFVQILFFLHLGRGPKPFYNVVFFFATAGLIVLVVGASLIIMDNLYRNMSPAEVTTRLAQDENIASVGGQRTGACQGNKVSHVVVISGSDVGPKHTQAKRCDTLTLKSGDGKDYELMFGSHEKPVSYGGLYEILVPRGRSKTITLNEAGDFSFEDHSNHNVVGHFTVTP